MRLRPGGLWRHADFRNLWTAQSISQVGSQVTVLALPLTAVLTLDAAAWQMGLLTAAGLLPRVALALVAGVWVDRRARRPIMIAADVGRALLLATIPLAAAFDRLRIEQLFVVAFLAGILTVFFDVAYRSCLPSLLTREQLVEGNSKLEVTASAALTAGPALAGGLVTLASAPLALTLDALSFAASAFFLTRIQAPERQVDSAVDATARHFRAELVEGLRVVFGNPVLRAIVGCSATWGFFDNVVMAVLTLYVTRQLDLGGGSLGLIYSSLGVGLLVGAVLAGPVNRRLGVGPAIIAGATFGSIGGVLLAGSGGRPLLALVVLMAGMALLGVGGAIYSVNQMTLRQALVPERLLGRANASLSFGVFSTMPLGALAGGLLGSAIGLRPTLVVGAVGSVAGFLWVIWSPLRSLRGQPAPLADPDVLALQR
jgi:MFS family permease